MAGTGSRTLKLSILADVSDLKKNLSAGSTEVDGFGSKLGDFSKKAAAAFAVAGVAAAAYASKLLIEGVKSAIEDEAAQARLATTLGNVTGATNAQVAAVEQYILKTELATGKTDDELRPSLDRLVRSTKDVAEAERLQAIALDVSAGSGKSLEAVSNALAKAHDGNFAALTKLGIGITAAEAKTMSFEQVTAKLSDTFANQASVQAETFQGKMDRLSVGFREAKETVGSFVLDAITPMVNTIVKDVIPQVMAFSSSVGTTLKPVIQNLTTFITGTLMPAFSAIWNFINDYIVPIIKTVLTPVIKGLKSAWDSVSTAITDNQDKLQPLMGFLEGLVKFIRDYVAPVIGTVLGGAFNLLGKAMGAVISIFSNIVSVLESVYKTIEKIINFIAGNTDAPVTTPLVIQPRVAGGRAAGGAVSAGSTYMVGEKGSELFVPQSNGTIVPHNALGGAPTYNITVNGAIDPEGAARAIIQVLNRSSARGTLGANQFTFA